MKLNAKLAVGGCVVVLIGLGVIASQRSRTTRETPNPAEILTATQPEDGGSEPARVPAAPILRNAATTSGRLAVGFGYKLGATAYAYRLGLTFDPDADRGRMDLGVAGGRAVETAPVTRRWSESRQAYLVATSHDFTDGVAAPNLCIRAVIGASKAALDLSGASLCVMQRDGDGRCHSATLACGQIR